MQNNEVLPMKPMSFTRHLIAYVTLGLLAGWYYFLFFLILPVLLFFLWRGSILAAIIFATLIYLTFSPIDHKVWPAFMSHWIWDIWVEYFDFTYDAKAFTDVYDPKERYLFFEFPHGVFPMGQLVSCSLINELTPGKNIVGAAADAVFLFPVIRQVLSWMGTFPARRQNIHRVFEQGMNCTIFVGGIAEMYLMNRESESIYLRQRLNTVKIAIQEGANIVPGFFFGNTSIFDVIGAKGSESWLSKLSRRLRASLLLFYGRHFLPVPYRHPLRMVVGKVIKVKQKDNPTNEDAIEVMNEVIKSVEELYAEKKPEWEKRPLIIL
eukprot:gene4959-5444_t